MNAILWNSDTNEQIHSFALTRIKHVTLIKRNLTTPNEAHTNVHTEHKTLIKIDFEDGTSRTYNAENYTMKYE